MESGKRYIKSESATCTHIVEENDPHEKLKALLNSPEEVDDCPPPVDAPKFGTVIHNRIFVGGFSLTATDEDLLNFFSSFAAVSGAKVIHDRAGVSKCYGFVTFVNPRVARLIVKQSGGVMFSPLGRLRVAQAVRKQNSQAQLEAAPLPAPLCYQLLCAPPMSAPCDIPPPPYALYPMPFEAAPAMYGPPAQYALIPAPYPTCCDAACCQIDKQRPPQAVHPAYIY